FSHRHFITRKEELIIFDYDFASLGGYFETVRPRRFPGGSVDNGRHTIRMLEIGCHIVFDLDIVIPAKIAKCADAGRHPKNPLENIQVVWALVEQQPAPLACPGSSPVTRLVVRFSPEPVSNRPVHTSDRSKIAGAHQLPE